MELPESFKPQLKLIEKHLLQSVLPTLPITLKEPIRYFLELPGKKIRPLLTLYAARMVGGNIEDALPAAIAVELFHDFTLIHDDIMDQDDLRRGFQTLHVKYGDGTAILVGDALIGLAYQQLLKSPAKYLDEVVDIFSEALVKVCEGQALDKEFEARSEVTEAEYLEMIGKKTGWLIKVSCALGAICGGGQPGQVRALAEFGYAIGLGFQIQDDLLDFVADEKILGKKVGSDFRMDKKTYVALKYWSILQENESLRQKYPHDLLDFSSFGEFQKALREMGAVEAVQNVAERYFREGLAALERVAPLDDNNPLYRLTRFLQHRRY